MSSATAPFPATTAASDWCSASSGTRSPRQAHRQSRALRRSNSAETSRNEAWKALETLGQNQNEWLIIMTLIASASLSR